MHNDELYPADVAPVARGLDELGELDRRAAGAGLERRVMQASWRQGSASGPRLASAGPAGGASWLGRPSMALAASVAVVAGGVAAWVAMQPGGAPAPAAVSLEQEVDVWLAIAGSDDGLHAEIDALRLLNDDLARGLEPGWLEDELSGESL